MDTITDVDGKWRMILSALLKFPTREKYDGDISPLVNMEAFYCPNGRTFSNNMPRKPKWPSYLTD